MPQRTPRVAERTKQDSTRPSHRLAIGSALVGWLAGCSLRPCSSPGPSFRAGTRSGGIERQRERSLRALGVPG